MVGDAVALLEQVNRDAKVTIEVDLQGAPQVVQLPDALLRQAVYNLVQNAVEASPQGGTVSVTAAAENGMFALGSKTAGPGIPQEIRERIFEPFFTTKPSSTGPGEWDSVSRWSAVRCTPWAATWKSLTFRKVARSSWCGCRSGPDQQEITHDDARQDPPCRR